MADMTKAVGAGLRDAKIKLADGTTLDVYGVVTANGETQREETEVRGDDTVLAVFGSALREEITVEANGISFDVLEAITGNTFTDTTTTGVIALGTDAEMNAPYVEVQAFSKAKLADGTVAEVKKSWHRVQFNTVSISQAGEQEVTCTLEGVALQTDRPIDYDGTDVPAFTNPAGNRIATLEVYTV